MSPLDDTGRCRMSELFPDQCGLPCHRNSPEPPVNDLVGITVQAERECLTDGICALDHRHHYQAGQHIGLAFDSDGLRVGWVCPRCVDDL